MEGKIDRQYLDSVTINDRGAQVDVFTMMEMYRDYGLDTIQHATRDVHLKLMLHRRTGFRKIARDAHNVSMRQPRRPKPVMRDVALGHLEGNQGQQIEECQRDLFVQLHEVISSLETHASSWRSPSAFESKEGHVTLGSNLCTAMLSSSVMRGLSQNTPALSPDEDQCSLQSQISRFREQNATLRFKLMVSDVELDKSKVALRNLVDEKENLQVKVKNLQDLLQDDDSFPHPNSSSALGDEVICDPRSDQLLSTSDQDPSEQAPLSTLQSLIQYLQSLPGIQPTQSGVSEVHPKSLEMDMKWLKRLHDRMKKLNDHLSGTLKECKTDSEKLTMHLGKLESTCTALRLALQSSERCLKTYSVLLALAEAKEEILLGQVVAGDFLKSGWSLLPKDLEIKTKLFMMEVKKTFHREGLNSGTKTTDSGSPTPQRFYTPWLSEEEEQILKDYIQSLKWDLASMSLQEQQAMGRNGTSHSQEVTHLADIIKTKVDDAVKSSVEASPGHSDKPLRAQIMQEIIETKEGLADIRANLQLIQTEKRTLELQIASHAEQEKAYILIRDQLQIELDEWETRGFWKNTGIHKYMDVAKNACRSSEQCGSSLDMQHLLDSLKGSCEMRVRVERLTSELDKLTCKVHVQKSQSAQVITDFFKAHRNLFITYQNACKKYKEQQHRLEAQVGVMLQHQCQELQNLMQDLMSLQAKRNARDTGETSL
ncbi:harmonin-binding protein USHBP1 [Pelodytes ibericus]